MAGGFLPQFGQTQPVTFGQSKLGQYIKNLPPVTQEASTGLFGGPQVPVPGINAPAQQPSKLIPPTPKPQPETEFVEQKQPSYDPNKIRAVIPSRQVTMPTSSVVTTQQPTEEEYSRLADVTEQEARYVGAQQELLDEQANWVAKQAEVKERLIGVEEGAQARRLEIDKAKNEEIKTQVQKLNDLNEDIKNYKVKDFWADKSTGTKIIASIGVALGAAGSALAGGPNAAMSILQNAVERDLQKQKENLRNKYVSADLQRGILAETYQMYGDQMTSVEAARAASYRAVGAEIDAMATKAQSDEMKAKILNLSEAVKLKAAEAELQFQQSLRSTVQQQFATKTFSGRVITNQDIVNKGMEQEGYVDYRDMIKEKKGKFFVPAYGGFTRKESEAEDLRQNASDRETMKSFLRELIKFRSEYGQWNQLDRKAKQRARTIHNEALLLKKGPAFDNLGVLAGPDMQVLIQSLGNPEDIFSFREEQYKTLLDSVNIREQNEVRQKIIPAIPETIPKFYRQNRKAISSAQEKFETKL